MYTNRVEEQGKTKNTWRKTIIENMNMKDLSGSIMIVTTLGILERVLLCVIYHCLKLLLSTIKKGIYFWYATRAALCDIYVELACATFELPLVI